jgi:hypothetical protein
MALTPCKRGVEFPRFGGRFDYAAIFSIFSLMNFNSNSIGLT